MRKMPGRLSLFLPALLLIGGCCHHGGEFDIRRLCGCFATPERSAVLMLDEDYVIAAAAPDQTTATDLPYRTAKQRYHIFRRGGSLFLQTGPGWSTGGIAYRIEGENRLSAGNFLDRGGVFERIPEAEVVRTIARFGYDLERLKAAPAYVPPFYGEDPKKDRKIILYDSFRVP